MPDPERITSLQNPRVKALVKLRQRRERDRQGLTLLDETLVIRRALAAGYPLRTAFYCPAAVRDDETRALFDDLRGLGSLDRSVEPGEESPDRLELVEVTPAILAKIAYREHPEGLVVLAPQVQRKLTELKLGPRPLLVVVEAIEKPGNLGAILRCADAAGADAVLCCDGGTDLFNPNVLRASRGTLFSVPTVVATTPAIQEWLAAAGITVLATSPAAAVNYTDCDLKGALALVLGTESSGLSATWHKVASQEIRIPMQGVADSLNVATTAAVLLFEARRQRS